MTELPTAEAISKALFETDPMHTCCKENDCFDEYDYVAGNVARRLDEGETLKTALAGAIGEWFYDGEDQPLEISVLRPTIEWLEKEQST